MVKTIEMRVRSPRRTDHAGDVATLVMNKAIHSDDVIENAEGGIEHVADRESDASAAEIARRALARKLDQRRRNVDRQHIRAAFGEFDGERARCRSRRRGRARRAGPPATSDTSVLRISSRPARTVARIRPTGASEVSRVQASTAVRSK